MEREARIGDGGSLDAIATDKVHSNCAGSEPLQRLRHCGGVSAGMHRVADRPRGVDSAVRGPGWARKAVRMQARTGDCGKDVAAGPAGREKDADLGCWGSFAGNSACGGRAGISRPLMDQ